jgi:hypothetical protein
MEIPQLKHVPGNSLARISGGLPKIVAPISRSAVLMDSRTAAISFDLEF